MTSAEDPEGRGRSLLCFDATDASLQLTRTVAVDRTMPTHQAHPYFGSTPASDGKVVIVWHGSAGLRAYDATDVEKWSKDLGEFRHMWGYGTSPSSQS